MRRYLTFALASALATALLAAPHAGIAQQPHVVQPHLRPLTKEPAVAHLKRFLGSLRARDHVSSEVHRGLIAKRRHLSSAARRTLEARDLARAKFLKRYLAKKGRRHKARVAKTSRQYYSYLRSLEGYKVRQVLAEISDELDRLAYS